VGTVADYMKQKYRRLNDENKKNIGTLRLPDKTPAMIDIVLIFSRGSAGQEKCLQIANGRRHTQMHLHFYLLYPHSATMLQILLHFFKLSLGIKRRRRYE
jgi:hypothetical protein